MMKRAGQSSNNKANHPALPVIRAGFGAVEGPTEIGLTRVVSLKGRRCPKSNVKSIELAFRLG